MKASSSFCLILFTVFCSTTTLVNSQDSCASNKLNVDPSLLRHIFFDTSSLKCLPVWDAHNFILRYSKTSENVWSFILSYPKNINAYAAMGFSSNGNMVGSSAVVSFGGSALMKQYYLGGTSQEQVIPDKGNLSSWNGVELISNDLSRVYFSFQLNTSEPSPHLIFAIGPAGAFPSGNNYLLSKHRDKTSINIDYAQGTTSAASSNLKLKRSHGVLNIAGWSIFMIVGTIIARYCKQWDPIWFYLHISVQTFGFAVGIVGMISGLALSNKVSTNVTNHKNIAILIVVLGLLQVMAFIIRPGKESKIRKYWNLYHHNLGRILILFAVVNTFYGLHLGGEGSNWFAAYGIALSILVIIIVILEIRMRIVSRKQLPSYN